MGHFGIMCDLDYLTNIHYQTINAFYIYRAIYLCSYAVTIPDALRLRLVLLKHKVL